jgi:TolB-like protein/Tfp pilus assembly protein PilF
MPTIIHFDCYEVDLAAGQLLKRGAKIRLREQCFQVLAALVERPGQVLTRDELRRRLWPDDVFVDFENNLNTAVARLREALNDSAENPRFIETLPRHGYRFIGILSRETAAAPEPVGTPSKRLMAVLPFLNLTGDPAQEHFSDAMADEMITALASLAPGQLAVIARTTAMHYKGSNKSVSDISHELGVDYVVEGGVHRAQDRLSINVQLIQAKDQMHLFARKYTSELREIFNVINRAASDIADSIGIPPSPQETRGAVLPGKDRRKPTADLAAYSDYIQGRHIMEKASAESFARAKTLLKSALTRDPEFALAYDALAEMHWYLGYFGFVRPREAFSAGIMYALRAIEIDNSCAETHALLGQFRKTIEYNWPEVQREMALALQLNPTSPLVRFRYATSWLMPQGRLEEAIAEVESALQLDPLSLLGRTWLTLLLSFSHQHEQTLEAARQVLEIDPNSYWAYVAMGSSYRNQGELGKAVAAFRRALEMPGSPVGLSGGLGITLGMSGKTEEARALLKRLQTMPAHVYVPPTSFAWIHLGLREIDSAFEWLNRAVDECDQYMMPIKSYRFFDPIRTDPRFQALLHKMNLDV